MNKIGSDHTLIIIKEGFKINENHTGVCEQRIGEPQGGARLTWKAHYIVNKVEPGGERIVLAIVDRV